MRPTENGAPVSKILLVAAEQGSRERLRLALERVEAAGGEVEFLEAVNGNAAMAVAERDHPDLVVVEVGVTPYGGFGLTRDLKASPELSCPVILVLERAQDEWLGRWCGADALVDRPVDPFALAQMADRLLGEDRGGTASGKAAS
jgi:DNA-binding response OmpR family regulator